MTAVRGSVWVLVVAVGGWACSAQEARVPFGQIERDAQLSARQMMADDAIPTNLSPINISSSSLSPGGTALEPPSGGAGGGGMIHRVPPVGFRRSIGAGFFALNGIHLGLAALDVGLTHRCIVSHQCREGNPLVPSNLAGALAVNISLVGSGAYLSYREKKRMARTWWLTPAAGSAAHVVGIATGIANQ